MTSTEKYESIMNELEDIRIEAVALSRLATLDETTMISHSDMVAHFNVAADGLRLNIAETVSHRSIVVKK